MSCAATITATTPATGPAIDTRAAATPSGTSGIAADPHRAPTGNDHQDRPGTDPATFAALLLPEPLLDTVAALGFTTPTAIQLAAIPALLSGADVTGVAQTGTGKTAAFGLPLLARVDPRARGVQALVLTPTRELALQVSEALTSFAAQLPGVAVTTVYGGAPIHRQVAALRRGAQVVVGTPGRIIDLLERGSLVLDDVRFAVLDEADEMLRMGFVDDVDRILAAAPTDRQTALFSATMPAAIRRVAARHLHRPVDVSVAASATPVPAIRQRYAVLPHRQKAEALVRFLAVRTAAGQSGPPSQPGTPSQSGTPNHACPPSDAGTAEGCQQAVASGVPRSDADAAVVFVRTRSACDEVAGVLRAGGVAAAVISGDVSQADRERTIAQLRSGQVDVLVATDVAARGLDVPRIGLVINYDAPADSETYVHRIGRTGRAGQAGQALLLLTRRELTRLRAIERATGQRLEQVTPPTAAEVTAHRAATLLRQATARHQAGRLDAHHAALAEAAERAGMSVTDLAAALLAVAVGDDGTPEPEPTRPEARMAESGSRGRRDARADRRADRDAEHHGRTRRGRTVAGPAATRYVVQVGHRHGVRPAGIVGAITGEGGLSGADLGRIDIFAYHSVVEIARPVRPDAMARIRRATVSGQQLRIRRDRAGGPAGSSGQSRPSGPSRKPESGRPTRSDRPRSGKRSAREDGRITRPHGAARTR